MRILMIVMLSLSFGLVLTLFPVEGLWLAAAALILLGVVFLVFMRKRELRLMLILLSAGIGMLWGLTYQKVYREPVLCYAGATLELQGEAVTYSSDSPYGVSVEARIPLEGTETRMTLWINERVEIRPGDRIQGTFRLKDSAASGSYYSYSDGIYLQGSARGETTIIPCDSVPLRYCTKVMAHRLELSLGEAFDETTQGYAMALTTGNRSKLSDISKANLKHSGIYHALALSGMHMVVLVGIVNQLVLKRKRLKALVGIPICVLFTVVTGCSPSVVRAAVMQCLCLLAYLFRRDKDTPTSLALALGLLMMENPWSIVNWGLQLSFLSVIGMELFGDGLTAFFYGKKRSKRKWINWGHWGLASSLSATASAMLITMPLMAVYFGFVSLVSPITHILTSAVISVCFGGSLLTALLGLLWPGGARAMGWVLGWGFRFVDWISGVIAQIPFGQAYTDTVYGIVMVVVIYLVFWAVWKSGKKVIPICCGSVLVSVCILLIMLEGIQPRVTALAVGQGQCILLQNGGSTMMVDCGGNEGNAGDTAADYLSSVGEQELDLLVLTHFDDDHVNGVPELMQRIPVKALAVPEQAGDTRQEIVSLAREMSVPVYVIRSDTEVSFGGAGVMLFAPVGRLEDNEAGLSVLAQLDGLSVLITGDMSENTEKILLAKEDIPEVDVLVAGHHGAKTSTSEALLKETRPECVMISVGENRYGHPAEEVLHRIEKSGALVYRTDILGNVTIKGES